MLNQFSCKGKPLLKVEETDWIMPYNNDLACLPRNISFLIRHQMSLVVKNRSSGFPTRSDTNRAVQPQKIARDLKFRI